MAAFLDSVWRALDIAQSRVLAVTKREVKTDPDEPLAGVCVRLALGDPAGCLKRLRFGDGFATLSKLSQHAACMSIQTRTT